MQNQNLKKHAPLQTMWCLYQRLRSSLSMGIKMYWSEQYQTFLFLR